MAEHTRMIAGTQPPAARGLNAYHIRFRVRCSIQPRAARESSCDKQQPMRAARRPAAPRYAALASLCDHRLQKVIDTTIVPVCETMPVLNVFISVIPTNPSRSEVNN